jgi:hypothetical protein
VHVSDPELVVQRYPVPWDHRWDVVWVSEISAMKREGEVAAVVEVYFVVLLSSQIKEGFSRDGRFWMREGDFAVAHLNHSFQSTARVNPIRPTQHLSSMLLPLPAATVIAFDLFPARSQP